VDCAGVWWAVPFFSFFILTQSQLILSRMVLFRVLVRLKRQSVTVAGLIQLATPPSRRFYDCAYRCALVVACVDSTPDIGRINRATRLGVLAGEAGPINIVRFLRDLMPPKIRLRY